MKTFKVKATKNGKTLESGVIASFHMAKIEADKQVKKGCSVVIIVAADTEGVNAGKYFLHWIVK